jgi:hypothetical protein
MILYCFDKKLTKLQRNILVPIYKLYSSWQPMVPQTIDCTAPLLFCCCVCRIFLFCFDYFLGPFLETTYIKHPLTLTFRSGLKSWWIPARTILTESLWRRLLTEADQMGERFKFMALFPATMNPIHDSDPPTGFYQGCAETKNPI